MEDRTGPETRYFEPCGWNDYEDAAAPCPNNAHSECQECPGLMLCGEHGRIHSREDHDHENTLLPHAGYQTAEW